MDIVTLRKTALLLNQIGVNSQFCQQNGAYIFNPNNEYKKEICDELSIVIDEMVKALQDLKTKIPSKTPETK